MSYSQLPDRAALLQEVAAAQQRGDAEGAGRLLDRLLGVWPDDGEAAHLRGVLALQQARLDEAVTFLRRAVAADAGASATANLGIALAASGRTHEAETVLRRAVELDGEHPQAAYNLGHLLAARGADREAEIWLGKAVSLAPGYSRASCELAALLLCDGRATEALDRLLAALDHDPQHPVVLLHLGLAARQLGDHATAIRRFMACRAALGPQRDLLLGLGGSLQESGRLDDAIAIYRELLVHEPSAYGAVLRTLASAPHGSFALRPTRMRALIGLA